VSVAGKSHRTIEKNTVKFSKKGDAVMAQVVITYSPGEQEQQLLADTLGQSAVLVYLKKADQQARRKALADADALLAWNPHRELHRDEFALLGRGQLMQLITAGADHLPYEHLPADLQIASNPGAYAEPMAEHVLAMILALAKNLSREHAKLKEGNFDQFSLNKQIKGSTAAIIGFGGIGKATAKLLRPLGAKIYAVNTSGRTAEPVDFIGTLDDLEQVFQAADFVVISLPFTKETRGLIGRRELEWLKPDAILVNVARGEIIVEKDLYEHLKTHPNFQAAIDAWWVEPFRHGQFRMDFPFLDLPNVLGSPHNSAMVPGAVAEATLQAAENILNFLSGRPVSGLVNREDYL